MRRRPGGRVTRHDARIAPGSMAPRSSSPSRSLGDCELLLELGRGGAGVVRLARKEGKLVAVKTLHAPDCSAKGVDQSLQQSLHEEARLSRFVRHPNVITTTDVFSHGREIVLVMPYVHGATLAALLRACIKRGTTVPVEIAATLVHDVLLGLHAAHIAKDEEGNALELVHRDVSPQNVLVGVDGRARLIDFGIAKARTSADLTLQGELKGKVPYIAPESIGGARVTRLADVWSAAVVLWEALCAKRLFGGKSPVETWSRVLGATVQKPSDVLGRAISLDEVVLRGLSRDVSARFSTALEMANAIAKASRLAPRARVTAWVRWAVGEDLAAREAKVRELTTLSVPPERPARPLVLPLPSRRALLALRLSATIA